MNRVLKVPSREIVRTHFLGIGVAVAVAACLCTATRVEAAEEPGLSRLKVALLDRSGKPVAGATVKFEGPHPTTELSANDGIASLNVPAEDLQQGWRVRVEKRGYVPRVIMPMGPDRRAFPNPVTVRLELPIGIGGTVRDEAGKPVPGATVSFASIWRARPNAVPFVELQDLNDVDVVCDAEGHWYFAGVSENLADVQVRVSHPEFLPTSTANDPEVAPVKALRDFSSVIVLKRGVSVKAKVVGPDGNPVANARIAPDIDRGGRTELRSGADGRFQFRAEEGDHVVRVTAPGMATLIETLRADSGASDATIRLHAARALVGKVIDPDGKPVPGAPLHISVAPAAGRSFLSLWQGRTGRDGDFKWDAAATGPLLCDVLAPGYMTVRGVKIDGSQGPQTLTLKRALAIQGTVADAETGKPIDAAVVTVGAGAEKGTKWWDASTAAKTAGGKYGVQLTEAAPAHFLRAQAEGYVTQISRAVTDDEADVAVDFKLKKSTAINGIVRDRGGKPVAGARVRMLAGNSPTATEELQPPPTADGATAVRVNSDETLTGADGRFTLVPTEETYTLNVTSDQGWGEAQPLAGGVVEISVQPWSRIDGIARLGAAPAANVEIALWNTPDENIAGGSRVRAYRSTVTDATGRFTFERLPAGLISVARTMPLRGGGRGYACTVSVQADAGQTVWVNLGGTGRPVVGRVQPPEGQRPRWALATGTLATKMPSPPLPPDLKNASSSEQAAWMQKFVITEAGKAYMAQLQKWQRSSISFTFNVNDDGSFRIEDVPAGEFDLTVLLAGTGGSRGEMASMLVGTQPVVVAPIAGDRIDQPLELPAVRLSVQQTR